MAIDDDIFLDELFSDGNSAMSDAERKRKQRAAHNYNAVERRAPADLARRRRLERKPEAWLKWYFPNIFRLPFSDGHRAMIKAVMGTDAAGKNVIVAAPRGEGKTNLLRHMAVYLVLTGRVRFVVVGGWQNRSASEAFSTWCIALTSERLVADYPEYCAPFAESTHASRLPRLHWVGEDEPTGAAIKSARMQIVFPDGLGAMAAGSLQGDIKGLNITTRGGASLRPDKLLLDDPQDVQRAADPVFVAEVLHTIDSQWMCLAGPDSRVSMMCACTIFAPDDVGDSLGKRKDSVFVRIPRVTSWPTGFMRNDSETRQLWDRWYDLYADDKTRAESLAFYRKNRRVMCDGFSVSWKERFDRNHGDPDALFAAMVDYYARGQDAFFSEYQNEPVSRKTTIYTITPQTVTAHRTDLPEGFAPDDTVLTVMTTDLNPSYGFTWEVASFSSHRSCHVLAHGVWAEPPLPTNERAMSQTQRQDIVRAALGVMGKWAAAQRWKPDLWLIDAGGEQFDTVLSFCQSPPDGSLRPQAIIGRAGKTYNPAVRTQFGRVQGRCYQCREPRRGRWVCFDADWYKETAQRSYIAEPGAAGSATLFNGNHREYAAQMCREVLDGKAEIAGRMVYSWTTAPGKHDYLDCHAMAWAAAGWQGLLTDGGEMGGNGGVSTSHRPLVGVSRSNKRKVYNG